jgi:hypothetical protein
MSPRFLATFFLVALLAAAALIAGAALLRFEAVDAETQQLLQELAREDPLQDQDPSRHKAEGGDARALRAQRIADALRLLQPWTSRDGMAAEARWTSSALVAFIDPARVESSVIDVLAVEPTSGSQWLLLARQLWRRGAPMAQVLGAIQMSTVTEPHEVSAMARRLPLLMQLWELLPDDRRRLAVNLLIELRGGADPGARQEIAAILANKSPAMRDALKTQLAARGGDRAWWRDIGLL